MGLVGQRRVVQPRVENDRVRHNREVLDVPQKHVLLRRWILDGYILHVACELDA